MPRNDVEAQKDEDSQDYSQNLQNKKSFNEILN